MGLTGIRYFIVGNLADSEAEVVRIAGLLRGTESAAQAVSVGLICLWSRVMADVVLFSTA